MTYWTLILYCLAGGIIYLPTLCCLFGKAFGAAILCFAACTGSLMLFLLGLWPAGAALWIAGGIGAALALRNVGRAAREDERHRETMAALRAIRDNSGRN